MVEEIKVDKGELVITQPTVEKERLNKEQAQQRITLINQRLTALQSQINLLNQKKATIQSAIPSLTSRDAREML